MPYDSRFPAAIVCLATSLLAIPAAQAQAPGPDAQLMQQGEALAAQGKHKEAAAAYEEMIKKYPQMPSVPEAYFRAGYAHYLAGEHDAALAAFKKVTDNKNLPAEMATIAELALSMSPQVLAAKAAKLKPEDPARAAALEEAVKQFDIYLAKYPNSDEAESASYGKALSLYQLERFEPAAEVLRGNMAKFAQSPTIQDSQFLLALTLATTASQKMQKAGGGDKAADAQYDEGEKLLRDIIGKNQNLALINDAWFQVGELLLARGGFLTGDENKQRQNEIFGKALDAYRAVASKERVLAAQKERVAFFTRLRNEALQRKDIPGFQKNKRLIDKETERLAQIEGRNDQTQAAKFKTGLIFFTQGKMDETRVLYTQLKNVGAIEDPEDKKQALYLVTMSYASQNAASKAVEEYAAFQKDYKGDPIAQNLQVMMGAMHLNSPDPAIKNPQKAIEYFNEGLQLYPSGKAFGPLVLMRATAQIELKQYAEAEKALQDILVKKPAKELAVDAELVLGTVQVQTEKLPAAVETFKGVRERYPDTPQAEQAHSQIGQLLASYNPKEAIGELNSFLSKYPKSVEVPGVMMALGKAQAATNQADAALATFKKLSTDFPKNPVAPYAFFESAKVLGGQQKFDETIAVMKEFIAAYPDDKALFDAYDFMAQILSSQGRSQEAIAAYDEFVAKRPKDEKSAEALLKLSGLWKSYTDAQGNYIVIEQAKRDEWKKGIEKSTEAAERLLKEFPESQQVAQALNNLMEGQRLLVVAKLKTEPDLEKYFQDLAQKFADKPGTQAKVLFTLASFTYQKDKARAVEQMTAAYKPELKFAPEDLDLYGEALIEGKKIDEAIAVYEKLDKDFPLRGAAPKTAARDIQEAQAIVLAGLGKALQEKGDAESKTRGAKMFTDLEANYPWSPKMLAVNYGIAVALHDQQKDDDAMKRLQEVILGKSASAELRAKSMLLLGKIHVAKGRFDAAIDNFIKISVFYPGVPKVAAEGLWLGGQLLERQASGEIQPPPAKVAAK